MVRLGAVTAIGLRLSACAPRTEALRQMPSSRERMAQVKPAKRRRNGGKA
jgi:hypothetical protein